MNCRETESIPITILEGGTFDRSFIWKTGSPAVPVDLTGYTAHMQIRAKLTDASPLLDVPFQAAPWTADGLTGIYIRADSPPAGEWRIYLKDDDTAGLCGTHKDIAGVYDLFLASPAGETVLRQWGVATIVAASTR